MKILLTGATGFLGKQLLKNLVKRPEVEKIWITSRHSISPSHPNIIPVKADLSSPSSIDALKTAIPEVDHILHIAGLYDFKSSNPDYYLQNVLSTEFISEFAKIRSAHIHYASSIACTLGGTNALPRKKQSSYAHTKAIAERLLLDSKLPVTIYRLGPLVGNSIDGRIEKLDGPYLFLKMVELFSKIPGTKLLPILTIPGNPKAKIPLTTVDSAAGAILQELFHPCGKKIIGVYPRNHVTAEELCISTFRYFGLKHLKPKFIAVSNPQFTTIAKKVLRENFEIFQYVLEPISLDSGLDLPEFNTYEEKFFQGFSDLRRDIQLHVE